MCYVRGCGWPIPAWVRFWTGLSGADDAGVESNGLIKANQEDEGVCKGVELDVAGAQRAKPTVPFFKRIFIYLFGGTRIFSCSMRDVVPWPGIEPGSPALGAWTLNHWTTREVPWTSGFYVTTPKQPPTISSLAPLLVCSLQLTCSTGTEHTAVR